MTVGNKVIDLMAALRTSLAAKPRPESGGFFEDETGWWMLDDATDDDGGWFIGRDGTERQIAWSDVPVLTYHSRR